MANERAPLRLRRVSLSVADQAVSSAGNLMVTIIAARSLSVGEFGAFSIAYTVSVLALGMIRSFTSEPLLVRFSHHDKLTARAEGAKSVGAALVLAVMAALVVAGSALLFSGSVRTALLLLAVGLPGLIVQDAWRFVCFAMGRPGIAVVNDLIWLATVLGLTALVRLTSTQTLANVTLVWISSSAICAILGGLQLKTLPSLTRARAWLRSHLDLGARFGADYAAAGGVGYVTLIGLGAIAGLPAAAAVRGVLTYFGPINIIYAGFTIALIPEGVRLARDDPKRFHRFIKLLGATLTALLGVWLVIGLLIPERLGTAILGDTWPDARSVLPALGIGLATGGVAGAAFVGLRSLGDARRSLRGRVIAAPILVGLPLAGAFLNSTEGYAFGFAAASAAAAVVWWVQFRLSMKTQERAGPVP